MFYLNDKNGYKTSIYYYKRKDYYLGLEFKNGDTLTGAFFDQEEDLGSNTKKIDKLPEFVQIQFIRMIFSMQGIK